jgi:hypothetical protein
MKQHPKNRARARKAEHIIAGYIDTTDPDDLFTATSDAISDIGHLCDLHGLDFVAILKKGIAYWKIETVDPTGLAASPDVDIFIAPYSAPEPGYRSQSVK